MMWTNSHNRRRRWLFSESQEQRPLNTEDTPPVIPRPAQPHQAFESLSRDRLMRRLLSNRLWKHAILCLTFCGVPALLTLTLMVTNTTGPNILWLPPGPLWALTGLELFTAAQLCLLIATVRSASCIDFHGSYRSWKWLSGFLCGSALLTLSHSAATATDTLAWILQPLTGPLQASRPALLFVPAAGLLIVILRVVVPDMRHSRWAQCLLVASAILSLVCFVSGTRLASSQATLLSAMALTTTGLLLSAILLHTRFVVHVNPNPPDASGSSAFKSAACSPQQRLANSLPASTDSDSTDSAAVPARQHDAMLRLPDNCEIAVPSTPGTLVDDSVPLRPAETITVLDEDAAQLPSSAGSRRGKSTTKRTRKSA